MTVDAAYFDRWLKTALLPVPDKDGTAVHLVNADGPLVLTPEQVRRLIARLANLSGHAPGPLPAGELEAIRGRAEAVYMADAHHSNTSLCSMNLTIKDVRQLARDDVPALLAALDAVTADLAAAEGALHDLTSPQSGESNAAYLRGVEDERGRCVALLRERAEIQRALGGVVSAGACLDAADLIESPPAPAAAREED